eukprot:scaffold175527_cov64-Attheya_sp.AAC.4
MAHGSSDIGGQAYVVGRHTWRGHSEARVGLGIRWDRASKMATLEKHVGGLEDRVVVMQRLIMGMAQEIETLRGELGHEGQSTMAVTELVLPTQGTTAGLDRLAADGERHGRADKEASTASSRVTTKLDASQLLEAEIQKAMQETAQGQAEGRFVLRDGRRHPINKRDGLVSDWPNEQGGKARFYANFGAHRPEHKQVKRMTEPTDCGKQIH